MIYLESHVEVPIYGGGLTLFVGSSVREILVEQLKEEEDPVFASWDALHYFNTDKFPGEDFILMERGLIDHGVIAHEAFHFAQGFLSGKGMKVINKSTAEPVAYLIQWTVAWMYGELKKQKIKIRL